MLITNVPSSSSTLSELFTKPFSKLCSPLDHNRVQKLGMFKGLLHVCQGSCRVRSHELEIVASLRPHLLYVPATCAPLITAADQTRDRTRDIWRWQSEPMVKVEPTNAYGPQKSPVDIINAMAGVEAANEA